MEPEVIAFDLFDTLLDLDSFDEEGALNVLRGCFPAEAGSRLDAAISEYYDRFVKVRYETLSESPFVDLISFCEKRLGILSRRDRRKAELQMFSFLKEHIGEHVPDTLRYLSSKGYRIAIYSNLRFSSGCISDRLGSYGIDGMFERVMSSADTGIRKPSPGAYLSVCREMGVGPGSICFIGNDIDKDVRGPMAVGMRAIHYRRTDDRYDVESIDSFDQLKDMFRCPP